MRILRYTLMSFAMLAVFSVAAFAQKDGDKKPPPKGNPPIITPAPKPNPTPTPRKPSAEFVAVWKDGMYESA